MRGIGLSLIIIAAGAGLFAYAATVPYFGDREVYLAIAGAALVPIGLIALVFAFRARGGRAYREALASADWVARWQVYPSDMEAFRGIDAARAGRRWSMKNFLKLPRSVPQEGFPVRIGETALLIGKRLYPYGFKHFGEAGEVTWHEGAPGFIEISCFIPMQAGVRNMMVLRIPVPAAAREQGAIAFRHIEGQISPYERDRLRRHFATHFEAAEQASDDPHWQQLRRPWVFGAIALFCLAMLAFIFVPRL